MSENRKYLFSKSLFQSSAPFSHVVIASSAHLATALSRPLTAELTTALMEPWTGEVGQAAYYRQVAMYDHDYTGKLEGLYPKIDVPTLVLWGEEDRWVDIAVGRKLHALIPGAKIETLPDAGHFSMLDCPGLFSRLLGRWLNDMTHKQEGDRRSASNVYAIN
jgi:pimeloyl-ACP methyl ester carboxylesterase